MTQNNSTCTTLNTCSQKVQQQLNHTISQTCLQTKAWNEICRYCMSTGDVWYLGDLPYLYSYCLEIDYEPFPASMKEIMNITKFVGIYDYFWCILIEIWFK